RLLRCEPLAPAEQENAITELCLQTETRNRFEAIENDRLQPLLFSIARNGAGERMRRKTFHRIGDLCDFAFSPWRNAFDVVHLQFARGQCAGFIERDDLHIREFFYRDAPAEEDAAAR